MLEKEYKGIKKKIKFRLSASDPSKPLKLITDGASSKGVGFVLFQLRDESKPELGTNIVAANSSRLNEVQLKYSPVDVELLSTRIRISLMSKPKFSV